MDEFTVAEDVEPTEEDSLLFSAIPGPRIFVMKDSEIHTMLGIVLDESDDSFLVALPARMVDFKADGEEPKKMIMPFINAPFIRLHKVSVSITTFMFEPFNEPYKAYVEEHGIKIFPDAQDFLDDWKEGYDEYMTEEEMAAEESTEVGTRDRDGVIRLGMSDEELAQYLASKSK